MTLLSASNFFSTKSVSQLTEPFCAPFIVNFEHGIHLKTVRNTIWEITSMRFSQVLVSVVCSSLLVFSASISAAVADGHAKRGVACTSCHIEGQPSATNVTEQSCINCHTETPKGKPITMDGHKVPNVHAGHFDTYECLQCHKGHKPSVSACSECHKTKLSVP
jgi:hypothetical protein